MDDKLFGALSLCKKAGALKIGFDAVKESVKKGEAALLLFARDVSPATQKRIQNASEEPPPMLPLPYEQKELAALTGKPAGVLAVINQDLAALVQKAAARQA